MIPLQVIYAGMAAVPAALLFFILQRVFRVERKFATGMGLALFFLLFTILVCSPPDI